MLHEFLVLSCFVTRVTPGLAPPASLFTGGAAAGLRGGVRSAASHSRHVGWSAAAQTPHPFGRGSAARCLTTRSYFAASANAPAPDDVCECLSP